MLNLEEINSLLKISKKWDKEKFNWKKIINFLKNQKLINLESLNLENEIKKLEIKLDLNNDNLLLYLISCFVRFTKNKNYIKYNEYSNYIIFLKDNLKKIFNKLNYNVFEVLNIKQKLKESKNKIFSRKEIIKFYKKNKIVDLWLIIKLFRDKFNLISVNDNENYILNKKIMREYFLQSEDDFFNTNYKLEKLDLYNLRNFLEEKFKPFIFLNEYTFELNSFINLFDNFLNNFLEIDEYNDKFLTKDEIIIFISKIFIYNKNYIIKYKNSFDIEILIEELNEFKSRLKLKENIELMDNNLINYNSKLNDNINKEIFQTKIKFNLIKQNIENIFKIYSRKHFNSQKGLFEDIKKKLKFINIGEFILFCNDFKIKNSKEYMNFKNLKKLFKNCFNNRNDINLIEFEYLIKKLSKLYFKYLPFFNKEEIYKKFINIFKLDDFSYVNDLLKKKLNSFQSFGIVIFGKKPKEKKLELIKNENRKLNKYKMKCLKKEKNNPLEYLYSLRKKFNKKNSIKKKNILSINLNSENRVKYNKNKYIEIVKTKKINSHIKKLSWNKLNKMNENDIKCIINQSGNNNFNSIKENNDNYELLKEYGIKKKKKIKKIDSFIKNIKQNHINNNKNLKNNIIKSKRELFNIKNYKNNNKKTKLIKK